MARMGISVSNLVTTTQVARANLIQFLIPIISTFGNIAELQKGNTMGLRFYPLLAYNIARNLDAKKSPEFYQWIEGLLNPRPGDREQQLILDNLGLITTLLIYSKKGV